MDLLSVSHFFFTPVEARLCNSPRTLCSIRPLSAMGWLRFLDILRCGCIPSVEMSQKGLFLSLVHFGAAPINVEIQPLEAVKTLPIIPQTRDS